MKKSFLIIVIGLMVISSSLWGQTPSIELVGQYTAKAASDLKVRGDFAYVTDLTAKQLYILNITDPTTPTLVGSYTSPHSEAMMVSLIDQYSYVTVGWSGFEVVDISNPALPTKVGPTHDTPGYTKDIEFANGHAFVAARESGVRVYDVSDPANPVYVTTYSTSAWATSMAISDNYLYIGIEHSPNGIDVFDISNPPTQNKVGSLSGSNSVMGIATDGNYVYHSGQWENTFNIVDVSNPSAPVRVGSGFPTHGDPWGIAVSGDVAFLGERGYGLQVLDISDKTNPVLLDEYNTGGDPLWGIQVVGDYVYLADGIGGVKVFSLAGSLPPPTGWQFAFGNWSVDGETLCRTGYELSPTGNQTFAWHPREGSDFDTTISFVINAINPDVNHSLGYDVRVGIVANTEGGIVGDDRKWSLIVSDRGVLQLLEENVAYRASTPFTPVEGLQYNMRMQIVSNTVNGKVWVDGDPEPDWMVTDNFAGPYNKYGVGVYAEGADVCFYPYSLPHDPCTDYPPIIVSSFVQANPLEVNSPDPSITPNEVEINERFTVFATIFNPCPYDPVTVLIDYSEISHSFDPQVGFTLFENLSLAEVTIQPGQEVTVPLHGLWHSWFWIDPWDWDRIWSLGGGYVPLVGEYWTAWAAANDFNEAIPNSGGNVSYEVSLHGIPNTAHTGNYYAAVSNQKWNLLVGSVASAVGGIYPTLVGTGMLLINPIAAIVSFAIEVLFQATGERMYQMAYDPDMDYQWTVEPLQIPVPPEILTADAVADTSLFCCYQMMSYEDALSTSYVKYQGAVVDGNYEWQLIHISNMLKLLETINSDIQYINTILSQIDPNLAFITSEKAESISVNFSTNGLPQIEQRMFQDFGFSTETIQEISDGLSAILMAQNSTLFLDVDVHSDAQARLESLRKSLRSAYNELKFLRHGDNSSSIPESEVNAYRQQRALLLQSIESDPTDIQLIRQWNYLNYRLDSLFMETGDSSVIGLLDSISIVNLAILEGMTPFELGGVRFGPETWPTCWTYDQDDSVTAIIYCFPDGYWPSDIVANSVMLNAQSAPIGDLQFRDSYPGIDGPVAVATFYRIDAMLSLGNRPALGENTVVIVGDFSDGKKFIATSVIAIEEGPEYSSLSGAVTNSLSNNLMGVNVDIYDSLGAMWKSLITDDSGCYHVDSIPTGDYSITLVSPLGYQTVLEIKEVTIACDPVVCDFELTQLEITPEQRGRGYWMHEVNALLSGKGNPQETFEDMCEYMELIRTHFNQHGLNPVNVFEVALTEDCDQRLEALRTAISPKSKATMNEKARAHLTALLLNMVSGKIAQWHPISEDSLNVSQAITFCNALITDGNPDNDETAKDIADMINEGQIVPAGMIDPTTANIAYKQNDQDQLPTEFALSQNYPNPFNPTTEISFALPNASDVKLEVFNIMGQRVAVLTEGPLEAGYHRIIWDGSQVASGVYFYRIDAGDFVETRKMVLLK